jgi:methionine synthase II (cobalamin-independent)
VLSVAFIKRPIVAVAPVTVAPVTAARVTVVGETPVATVKVVLASPATYVAVAAPGLPDLVDTKNVYEPALSGWNTTFTEFTEALEVPAT